MVIDLLIMAAVAFIVALLAIYLSYNVDFVAQIVGR